MTKNWARAVQQPVRRALRRARLRNVAHRLHQLGQRRPRQRFSSVGVPTS